MQTTAVTADGRHDGDSQPVGERLVVDLHAAIGRLVAHIQGEHDRLAQLDKLQRQLERPAEPTGVGHIDDQVVVPGEQVG